MGITQPELTAVCAQLQRLVGQRLRNAWQPSRDRIFLGFDEEILLLVPRGTFARVHSVAGRPKNPPQPYSFQGALRARLGAPLSAIAVATHDRIITLEFDHWSLLLRLTGASGGLWLLNERGQPEAAFDGLAPETLPPLPSPGIVPTAERFPLTPDADLAARLFFSHEERVAQERALRTSLHRRLSARLARDRRLLGKLDADLTRAEQAPVLRNLADNLAAILHTIKRGTTSVTVDDLMHPGTSLTITLDPAKSPGENLSRLYHKVGRLDRAGDHVLARIVETEERVEATSSLLASLEAATPAELHTLDAQHPAKRQSPATTAAQVALPWHTWQGPTGQHILVGRNANGNRLLSFQRARGHDVWLHIRERPGAHLLIPCRPSHPPSLQLLLIAAELSLAAAGIPEGVAQDVMYTFARNVRALKGAPDGLVQVHSERVLHVKRDPSLLKGWTRLGAPA